MCTAIAMMGEFPLFGRTLDVSADYGERLLLTPREKTIFFRHAKAPKRHPAMVGVGLERGGMPLYFDAMNEAGLAVAGLNFPVSAVYHPPKAGMYAVGSFELIPFLLTRCESVTEAEELLRRTVITPDRFDEELPATPLHWIVTDGARAVCVESVAGGLCVTENTVGVLTNEPPFAFQLAHLSQYLRLGSEPPANTLCPEVALDVWSSGGGSVGLPGDFSSLSRFARAVFVKHHLAQVGASGQAVSRFFQMADLLRVPRGCVRTQTGEEMFTAYTACADLRGGSYYLAHEGCRRLCRVTLRGACEGKELRSFEIPRAEDVRLLNG